MLNKDYRLSIRDITFFHENYFFNILYDYFQKRVLDKTLSHKGEEVVLHNKNVFTGERISVKGVDEMLRFTNHVLDTGDKRVHGYISEVEFYGMKLPDYEFFMYELVGKRNNKKLNFDIDASSGFNQCDEKYLTHDTTFKKWFTNLIRFNKTRKILTTTLSNESCLKNYLVDKEREFPSDYIMTKNPWDSNDNSYYDFKSIIQNVGSGFSKKFEDHLLDITCDDPIDKGFSGKCTFITNDEYKPDFYNALSLGKTEYNSNAKFEGEFLCVIETLSGFIGCYTKIFYKGEELLKGDLLFVFCGYKTCFMRFTEKECEESNSPIFKRGLLLKKMLNYYLTYKDGYSHSEDKLVKFYKKGA